eukprot:4239507-Prymnesium_polylepis.1
MSPPLARAVPDPHRGLWPPPREGGAAPEVHRTKGMLLHGRWELSEVVRHAQRRRPAAHVPELVDINEDDP